MAQDQWYVLQTRPKKEGIVVGLLQQANVEVFLPKIRRVSTVAPLFPRYCFLHADLQDAAMHHMVRFTRGVTQILGDEIGPVPINPEVVETLRSSTNDNSCLEQELLYRPGDTVQVRDGILSDLVGLVEKNLSDQGRVRVLFKWMNRSLRADIDYRQLERVA